MEVSLEVMTILGFVRPSIRLATACQLGKQRHFYTGAAEWSTTTRKDETNSLEVTRMNMREMMTCLNQHDE